eukprot:3209913-Pyramimonas_sp.AAC.1
MITPSRGTMTGTPAAIAAKASLRSTRKAALKAVSLKKEMSPSAKVNVEDTVGKVGPASMSAVDSQPCTHTC